MDIEGPPQVDICGELQTELDYVSNSNPVMVEFKIGPDHQELSNLLSLP